MTDDSPSSSARLDVAELTSVIAGSDEALTVFAPTDEAFERCARDRALAFEELAERENLGEILKYHVVSGAVKSSDLKSGQVKTLNGRSVKVDVAGGEVKVDGVKVTEADKAAFGGNVVVHVVDEVVFPAFSINAKVQTPQEILAFEGWAPEVINGRVAMLGFVLALAGEIATGESFTTQAGAQLWRAHAHDVRVELGVSFPGVQFERGGTRRTRSRWLTVRNGNLFSAVCPPWLAVKDVFFARG